MFYIANNANINEVYFAKYQVNDGRYEIVEKTMLLDKSKFNSEKNDDTMQFGNYPIKGKDFQSSSPNAISIAKWAYIFGNDLVTFEHDFLEPNYLKNFVVKKK